MCMNLSTQPWTVGRIIMFPQSIEHILECIVRVFQTSWVQFILSTNFESHPHDIQRASLTAAASFLCFTCQSGPAPSLARLSILPSFHLGGGCLSINHPSMWKDRKKKGEREKLKIWNRKGYFEKDQSKIGEMYVHSAQKLLFLLINHYNMQYNLKKGEILK